MILNLTFLQCLLWNSRYTPKIQVHEIVRDFKFLFLAYDGDTETLNATQSSCTERANQIQFEDSGHNGYNLKTKQNKASNQPNETAKRDAEHFIQTAVGLLCN